MRVAVQYLEVITNRSPSGEIDIVQGVVLALARSYKSACVCVCVCVCVR